MKCKNVEVCWIPAHEEDDKATKAATIMSSLHVDIPNK